MVKPMPISPTPRHRVTIQSVWTVAKASTKPLTSEVYARLGPYLTRYGETMNLRVRAVGGASDHLRLLADLPMNLAMATVTTELQQASARFVREALGIADFAWNEEAHTVSVSPDRVDPVAEYIASQAEHCVSDGVLDAFLEGTDTDPAEPDKDEMPAWLRDALHSGGGGSR